VSLKTLSATATYQNKVSGTKMSKKMFTSLVTEKTCS